MASTPNFESRVEAVFGALQTSGTADTWSLNQNQIFRSGKEADYSSEEEEQANVDAARREQLLPQSVDLDGETNEAGELPSNAFCRALDNEEEFDANDMLASGVVDHRPEDRPSKHTQVLDGNIFERASQARQDRSAAGDAMEVDPPAPAAAPPPTQAGGGGPGKDELVQGNPKRVRFAVPPDSAAPGEVARPPHGGGAGEDPGKPPLSPKSSRGRGRGRGRGRSNNRGGSFVPDHVKHPERYTVYVLDEPIVVGSGDAGAADKIAPPDKVDGDDVGEGAAPSQPVELPSFGAGIAFNPGQKRAAKEPSEAAARANQGGLTTMAEEAAAEEDIPMEEDLGSPVGDFLPKARRQRNLRSRG